MDFYLQLKTVSFNKDFSFILLYLDMPRVMQIWNVYRSRAVGYSLSKYGYHLIDNIRWTDEESCDFAFAGLYQNQIVAVGTLGCSKNVQARILLINGFVEMIKRINPKMIIIYGPICKELKTVLGKYNVSYIQFDSDTQSFFKGVDNGPEK